MTNEGQLLTLRETANRLRQSEKTIRRNVHSGEILAVRLGPSPHAPLRIPADFLDAWLYAEPIKERSSD
jgi:excisionase family DNA binding protein